MPMSEAKKKANKKWNDSNRKTFTVSLSIKEFEELEKYCKYNKISRSGLIKSRIDEIIHPQ